MWIQILLEIAEVFQELQEQFAQRLFILRFKWFHLFIHVNRVDVIDFLQKKIIDQLKPRIDGSELGQGLRGLLETFADTFHANMEEWPAQQRTEGNGWPSKSANSLILSYLLRCLCNGIAPKFSRSSPKVANANPLKRVSNFNFKKYPFSRNFKRTHFGCSNAGGVCFEFQHNYWNSDQFPAYVMYRWIEELVLSLESN